jgi:hypothetical protein
MLFLKLLLVASSVLLSTLAVRRFGHAVGGAVAGMPMIAAPIIGILLLDHTSVEVRGIALATLACVPATILHIVTFAAAARVSTWLISVTAALLAYSVAGALLTHTSLGPVAICILAFIAPVSGLWFVARHSSARIPVHVPQIELVLRVAAAVVMAAVILLGADTLPTALSGILLAVPITGTILPCFTLHRYGAAATASLMNGFLQGLHGFTAFFLALYWALAHMNSAAAFCVALTAALAMALAVQAARRFYSNFSTEIRS